MKYSVMLRATTLLSIVLFLIHLTSDITLGKEPGTASNLNAIPIMVVWLCGAMLLSERRSGQVIMLIGALLAAVVPILHMRSGVGGAFARSSGAYLFISILFALGVTGTFSIILSVHELLKPRVASARSEDGS